MADEEILFDDVYELCEVIGRYVTLYKARQGSLSPALVRNSIFVVSIRSIVPDCRHKSWLAFTGLCGCSYATLHGIALDWEACVLLGRICLWEDWFYCLLNFYGYLSFFFWEGVNLTGVKFDILFYDGLVAGRESWGCPDKCWFRIISFKCNQ